MQDVIVIGGGPAGSTTASFLAKHGHPVTLLEKEKFPRDHVGESLLPFCYKTFGALGVLDEMKGLFVRKPTVRFMTIDGKQSTNWCFNQVIKDESFLSFQVDRKVFDKLLLDNSRRLGVDVQEETKVANVKFDTDADQVFVSAIGLDGEKKTCTGRFLVDASGRSTFMATKNNWRTSNVGFERTAVWTHFIYVKNMIGGLDEGSSLIVYLGGEKRGWIWVFPLEKDRVTVGVVVDSFYLRDKKRELQAAGVEDWQNAFFFDEIGESLFVSKIVEGAELMMPLVVEGDYSYNSKIKYGPRFALVGDAGRFIDPIFSSGVFLSTKSAWLLADALHKIFESGDLDKNEPLVAAYDYINGAYNFVYRLINLFYNPQSISFAEASTFFKEYEDHQSAMAAGHFILSGDFFENHKKYHSFLDILESERNYRLFKNVVVNRKNPEAESCNLKPEELEIIFPEKSLRLAE